MGRRRSQSSAHLLQKKAHGVAVGVVRPEGTGGGGGEVGGCRPLPGRRSKRGQGRLADEHAVVTYARESQEPEDEHHGTRARSRARASRERPCAAEAPPIPSAPGVHQGLSTHGVATTGAARRAAGRRIIAWQPTWARRPAARRARSTDPGRSPPQHEPKHDAGPGEQGGPGEPPRCWSSRPRGRRAARSWLYKRRQAIPCVQNRHLCARGGRLGERGARKIILTSDND